MRRFNYRPMTARPVKLKGTSRVRENTLKFKDITLADMPVINRIVQMSASRTCDYTIGGIFMWIKYFRYQYCIFRETLFIKGISELDLRSTAFSLPIGRLPVSEAIELLRHYCEENGITLRFSAIPEDRLSDFISVGLTDSELLTDWSDYLYDIETMATLSGKKMNKKRNHVNRFMADNPGYSFTRVTRSDIATLISCCEKWQNDDPATGPTALTEHDEVISVLENLICYPFEGAVLRDAAGRPVAFTLGEIVGDTLYVHVEKMNHEVAGAGETVSKLFAEAMLAKFPSLRYVNREEDAGDEGLRRSKESYRPTMILRKYDITL